MPTAEIITIGTEILLGDILDTNARHIAGALREAGIDLYRKTTIGDNPVRIAQVIREALERADILLLTGGLGPTVDDPTRQAVALAVGVEVEYRPELWEQIKARFKKFGREPTENNKRQAFIPAGALAVENPVGTAPSFIVRQGDKSIIALPGVPREMEYLLEKAVLPYLKAHYRLESVIKSRVLHTSGAGESQVDDRIGDLEAGSNPTVGLAAHSGQVDVRITAKASTPEAAFALIAPVEQAIRERLGEWVFGADDETLEAVALQRMANHGWKVVVLESGLGGRLIQCLAGTSGPFLGGEVLTEPPEKSELLPMLRRYLAERNAEVAVGVVLVQQEGRQELALAAISPERERQIERTFGGHPSLAVIWSVNAGLDLLRKL